LSNGKQKLAIRKIKNKFSARVSRAKKKNQEASLKQQKKSLKNKYLELICTINKNLKFENEILKEKNETLEHVLNQTHMTQYHGSFSTNC